MEFQKIVENVLNEDMVAGGDASVYGPSVSNTATPFSGDTYATGDARNPSGIFAGLITRRGIKHKKRKKRSKRRSKYNKAA